MYILDGQQLELGQPFTHNNIKYPANWLELSTKPDRDSIGIIEVPDQPPFDARFYYGYDANGNLLPKNHQQLIADWSAQTRATAFTLMQPTDWMIIREADNGQLADAATKAWRESIRVASHDKTTAIAATADTPALAAYITGEDYPTWPTQN